jgi:hypothetical protein
MAGSFRIGLNIKKCATTPADAIAHYILQPAGILWAAQVNLQIAAYKESRLFSSYSSRMGLDDP